MLSEPAATEARGAGDGGSADRVRFYQKTPLRNDPESRRAAEAGGRGFPLALGSRRDWQQPCRLAGLEEAASQKTDSFAL